MPICIAGRASSDTRFCRRGPLPINEDLRLQPYCVQSSIFPFTTVGLPENMASSSLSVYTNQNVFCLCFTMQEGGSKHLRIYGELKSKTRHSSSLPQWKYVHTGRGSGEQPERHHQTTSVTLGLLLITNGATG